jgi:hypothetical protein
LETEVVDWEKEVVDWEKQVVVEIEEEPLLEVDRID